MIAASKIAKIFHSVATSGGVRAEKTSTGFDTTGIIVCCDSFTNLSQIMSKSRNAVCSATYPNDSGAPNTEPETLPPKSLV